MRRREPEGPRSYLHLQMRRLSPGALEPRRGRRSVPTTALIVVFYLSLAIGLLAVGSIVLYGLVAGDPLPVHTP